MATLKPLHQSLLRHHHHSSTTTTTTHDLTSFLFKPTKRFNYKLSSNLSSSSSSSSITTSTTPTTSTTSLDLLAHHLSSADYRQADEETRRLLIALAGDAAQKRGYVFFSEVKFISADDLRAIDRLWRANSGGRFGYSVQRRLWEKARRDFTRFFIRVGWMKKLESEVEQYNYRSFPSEFIWELKDDTPEGHLPLTNALRGTQLLACVLTHPAFEEDKEEEEIEDNGDGGGEQKSVEKGRERPKLMNFKTDYSF
ncbi:tetrapyrrole-binding protein, chloroplastic [Typha latifolia]|uniref:tetrapyrrole-binding protein, chloroplastic n=1 Tax=Typha latifolia TaxID=4733 RepID=UPI003C2F617B